MPIVNLPKNQWEHVIFLLEVMRDDMLAEFDDDLKERDKLDGIIIKIKTQTKIGGRLDLVPIRVWENI